MNLESRYEWCWKAFADYLIYWKWLNDYRYAERHANRCEVYKHFILCSESN